jgi:RimJ/RimL family protein N-acetyltransferase
MIQLEEFQPEDSDRLIGWIPDARFLLQWAGPGYSWPLDKEQLLSTIERSKGPRSPQRMFKAVESDSGVTVGHIQLVRVDYDKERGHIGRVLVGPSELRGRGYGRQILLRLIEYCRSELGLEELTLAVFDFNHPAIACYESIGFQQIELKENAGQFETESWNVINMRLLLKDVDQEEQRLPTTE